MPWINKFKDECCDKELKESIVDDIEVVFCSNVEIANR